MSTVWKQSWALARKELRAYFGSPMALIFVGAFLAATLFSFFWAEGFFVRNIADVRPLFSWMPILMILLLSTLTMRQWSEEQRSGTQEVLLTLPVRREALVLGKFIAVMALVALSLALTLFLPITVGLLGSLDWGPVVGGYVAALLLAAAYAAIGLFVSSRTDNQIVALMLSALLCGAFYLLGSTSITNLVGDTPGEILRAIGTGSRFESIERGVIDLRDLIYYLSLTGVFLWLNVFSLDAKRWSRGPEAARRRRDAVLRVGLVVANLLAVNVWLYPLNGLRADLTAAREYSLSPTTLNLIRSLQEPLLIRGYFSEKTHPLLAPLVPAVRDMLHEYQVASGNKIRVEIVDPANNQDLETEANDVYGITPTPFRITGRYETSVVNSYFNLLVRYGSQHETLGFQDLIEVNQSPDGQVDVRLRNLEYDLTRSIKKAVSGFQSIDSILASTDKPVKLTAYVTARTLPSSLQNVPAALQKVLQDMQQSSSGKLTGQIIDPDTAGSGATRQSLLSTYGIRPIASSLFSTDSYYLHMVLQVGDKASVIYPTGDMSEATIRSEIESALKRATPGFLKTVGLWQPDTSAASASGQQPLSTWQSLADQLATSYTVQPVDLKSGSVPAGVDVLVVVAPQAMTEPEVFAIDQYLMRGGAVIVAGGSTVLSQQQYGGSILLQNVQGGLKDLLAAYGVNVGNGLVMDPQNITMPMQVQRQVGNSTTTQLQQVSYPFFVDIRSDGMAANSPIVSSIPAITLQFASPVELDAAKNKDRQTTVLLSSTAKSWLRTSLDTAPNPQQYPPYGFQVEGTPKAYPLAVSVRGSFESLYKGKPSPLQTSQPMTGTATTTNTVSSGVLETSPESARLVVIGSGEFLDDPILSLSRNLTQDRDLLSLQFVQNAVDWCVEDQDLLSIRSRGTYAHLLKPLTPSQQSLWEGVNYAVALSALIALGVVWNTRRRNEQPMHLVEVPAGRDGKGEK
jgi:ABC-2 type transport system permease protein